MNYSGLTDSELAKELFFAANPDSEVRVTAYTTSSNVLLTYPNDEDLIFSILNFNDLMPLALENHVFYEFKLGDDYNRGMYKSVAVFEHGHDHITFDKCVHRSLAITTIKVLKEKIDINCT